MIAEDIPLPHGRPGTRRSVPVLRFGAPAGGGPKAYIQAGLHADESPGHLVAQHLRERLTDLDAGGLVRGEIVLVPCANPIGLDQVLLGQHAGRFELASGVNFNRAYADLAARVADRVAGRLGPDAGRNVQLVRAELRAAARTLPAQTEAEALRRLLLSLAADADIVLDLHCDAEAVMHMYTGAELWPAAADLAAETGCRAVFLASESGGEPFDEACSGLWWRLRARLGGEAPLPAACLAATLELRGQSDVDDALAAEDAAAILRFLTRRGLIAGEAPPLPPALCEATPLAGVLRVRAPSAGIVAHKVALGTRVAAGEVVAELVDPVAGTRTPVASALEGLVWARARDRYVGAGDIVASIATPEACVPDGAKLLSS
ncbi:MAG TPA: succinylglutamate desuccinylase/aspartoacylase family protein [Azospirillaceae bacterium]|nr:succinylglutamate desuccinylase/aspartoacylase family protein [Azospirillaceae bacterium]